MGRKSSRNQKKKAEGKDEPTAKGTLPKPKAKNNKASTKATAPLFELSGDPEFYEVDCPVEQQHDNEWIYPNQFAAPWYDYFGYYTNNQFIDPGYFQPVPVWNYGYDTPHNPMGYADNTPFWDVSTFSDQVSVVDAVDDMIASITASTAVPTEVFQLRADAPEFVPQGKAETKAA